MSRSRDGEILHDFVADISQQIARFTPEPIFVSRSRADSPHLLAFHRPAQLSRDLFLRVRHYFTIAEGAARTAGYHYAIESAVGREILVYHWHPAAPPSDPHLHLESGALVGRRELTAVHIPTGPVRLSDLLWLLSQITRR